jgi:kynurenine formamidase
VDPEEGRVISVDRRHIMTAAAAGFVGAVAGGSLTGGGPAQAAAPAAGADQTTNGGLRPGHIRLVSLSHVNDPAKTPVFPGDPEFKLTTAFTIPQDGFYLQYVQEGEHTGTHWGAPGHFEEGGLLADDLDPNDLLLPAVKIDIRAKAARDADYQLTVADLGDFERAYGPIPQEAAVVLWTGWEDRWGTPAYANLDGDGVIHQPGFGIESVHWLIDNGKLGRRGSLGSDTFGADPGIDDTFAASTLLFHRHRISLENLANLRQLPATGAWVLPGGPINRRGSGSPANVFGLIPG